MTKQHHSAPANSGQYRVELSRTSKSPQWWEYQIIETATGAPVAGGEIRGARHLAQLAGDREARRIEAARQPFWIPPVTNGLRIPC